MLSNPEPLHSDSGDVAGAPAVARSGRGREASIRLDHPTVGGCYLARNHSPAMGDSAGAVVALEEAIVPLRKSYGDKHRETLVVINTLAIALKQAGNPQRGAELLTPGLADATAAFGRDDPLTIGILSNLAEMHRARGDPAAAVPLFEEAARSAPAVMGKNSPNTLQIMHNLAVTYRAAGSRGLARTFLERLKVARTARQPPACHSPASYREQART